MDILEKLLPQLSTELELVDSQGEGVIMEESVRMEGVTRTILLHSIIISSYQMSNILYQ